MEKKREQELSVLEALRLHREFHLPRPVPADEQEKPLDNGTRSAVNNIGQLLLCHAAGFSSPLDSKPYIVKIKASFISFYLHNIT